MARVGTIDVDISLKAEALGDGQYANLIEELIKHSYEQRETLRRFQLVRQVPAIDGGGPIEIIVDFLMPKHAEIVRNVPPLISEFAVQEADGADLALRFYQMAAIAGPMPAGGMSSVQVAVCSIPALLAIKGMPFITEIRKRVPTTSIAASGTTLANLRLLRRPACHCWTMQAGDKALSILHPNSTT